jgi:hypothetical protein
MFFLLKPKFSTDGFRTLNSTFVSIGIFLRLHFSVSVK